MEEKKYKSGFVNIIGNPNVGKSTLMNKLIGERLSIITSKAQTTRHRILGIVNDENGVMSKPLEQCPEIKGKRYDLCTIVHVLEHTYDPLKTLKEINKRLCDGGVLYIEVPNVKTPYGWLAKNYFILYHLYYFSDSTLELLLKKTGFIIESKAVQNNTSVGYICRKKNTEIIEPEYEYDDYLDIIRILNIYHKKSFVRNILLSMGAKKMKKCMKKLLYIT